MTQSNFKTELKLKFCLKLLESHKITKVFPKYFETILFLHSTDLQTKHPRCLGHKAAYNNFLLAGIRSRMLNLTEEYFSN